MRDEVLKKVVEIFQEEIDDETVVVTPDSNIMDDLELSSLDIFDILLEMEDVFDLEVSDELLRKMIYVKDAAEIICALKEEA